jgi:hypothetical protein
MKLRIAATVYVFATSLAAVVIFAVHLHAAIGAFSPLDPTHYGPLVPGVTKSSIGGLPRLPMLMGAVAALTSLVALWLWRSDKAVETRTFIVASLASLNLFAVAFGPLWFLNVYFVLPKVMNAG